MREILVAGFGGQGILFSGKFLAGIGMLQKSEVSWLPSYGPEMRGGTANCSVIISDTPIGSPLVIRPNILICMNLPSLDKFEKNLAENGSLFINSSLIERKSVLSGEGIHYIPATQLAVDNGLDGLGIMIVLGKVLRETGLCSREFAAKAMDITVAAQKSDAIDRNLKAIDIGMNFNS